MTSKNRRSAHFLPMCTYPPPADAPRDLRGYWIELPEILRDVEG